MGLIEKYTNFACENGAKCSRTPAFFRVIRQLNLCRENLKLLRIKYDKMTDVPVRASLTSKDAKELIFSTIANIVLMLYASF